MKSFLDGMEGIGTITKWHGKSLLPIHSEKILQLMTHGMELGLEQVSPLGHLSHLVSLGDFYFGPSLHEHLINMKYSLPLTFVCLSLFTPR